MTNKTPTKTFSRLFLWELETNLNLPTLAIIIASATITILVQSSSNMWINNYANLYYGANTVFLILTLVACTLFSHSFAGNYGNGELKRILSYPVKRWQVFLSKITALNLIIFTIYASTYTIHLYLNSLNLIEPMFYISLFAIFLHLLLVCAISVGISMTTKNELMSIITTFLLFLGLDTTFNTISYFSSNGRFTYIFGYLEHLLHSEPYQVYYLQPGIPVTLEQAIISITLPLAIIIIVLVTTFIYFTRKMEVD